MRSVALVVSDVDGTLLTKDKTLTEASVDAVRKLGKAGIGITITSSRPTIGMRFLVEALGITLPVGAFNGSAIIDPAMNPIEQHLLPVDVVHRSLELLASFGVDIWLFTNDAWLAQNGEGAYVPLEKRAIKADPNVVSDFSPYVARACKIVGSSSDPALLIRCEEAVRDALGGQATAVRSQSYYLDITPPGHNKGTFVQTIAKRLGIATSAVATIGDMQNDLAMFAVSGLSFAMGNATDDVKRQASRVTASNQDDGFARAVEVILRENKPV